MKENKFALWVLCPIVLSAIVGAFARIMLGLDHNEHMYIAASVLVSQNQELYKDFAYLQMPYLPLLYGNLYRLLGVSSYYLFVGKLLSFVFLIISSLTLWLLARRILRDVVLSLSVVTLFLLNMTIVNAAAEVSNYIIPVALSMLSFYLLHVSNVENQFKPSRAAVAGIFLAAAIGTKLTYAAAVIPFVAMILLYPAMSEHPARDIRKHVVHVLFPFIAGLFIGLLPTLFFMLDLEAFVFDNLGYHSVNAQWRLATGYAGPMTLSSKLAYARQIYFQADNLTLLLGIAIGFGCSIGSFQTIRQVSRQLHRGALCALLLVLCAVPFALVPTPSFPQYFAMPVSFLFLLLVFSGGPRSLEVPTLHLRRLLLILVLVSAAYNGRGPILGLMHRDGWSGLRVHDVSTNVRKKLMDDGAGTDGKIATLSPIFAIESNLPIYSELATGPFLYRVGDLLTDEERKHFVGTSAKSIGALFAKDPPAAILVGLEGDLDKPLIEYAVINNYRKVEVAGFDGDLYVKP